MRSLLSGLLAALPPVGPVARPSPPPAESEALGAALAAWEALGGTGRGCTAGEALAAAKGRPEAWEAFCRAVAEIRGEGVAMSIRGRSAKAAAHALGNVLKVLRGRTGSGGRVLVGELTRTKSMRWRVAPGPVREGAGSEGEGTVGAGGRWDGYQPVDGPEPPTLARG